MSELVLLSHFQAAVLLRAHQSGLQQVNISLDLNLTSTDVVLESNGVVLPDSRRLSWGQVGEIKEDENNCFLIESDGLRKVREFSELTDRYYSLYPTSKAPTMLISGLPMHRIKGTDPHQDTLEKIKAAKPRGRVLDTATGLGYTAIQAAKTASQVVTIELDPTALEIAWHNPWSGKLFSSGNIQQVIGDSFDVIEEMDSEQFTCIIHDPPMFNLAGHLYSGDFYRELYRVLRPKGRLFHYIGNPDSKSGGSTTKGVIRRLEQAGFQRVERKPRAFGVAAQK